MLYTDGVIEAGAPEDELGVEGLTEVLRRRAARRPRAAQTVAAVEAAVGDRGEGAARDDVAMLVVRAGGT